MENLIGSAEIAELLGVTRQQVHRLAAREDFPAPAAKVKGGRVWREREVKAWARANKNRKPGRPEKPWARD